MIDVVIDLSHHNTGTNNGPIDFNAVQGTGIVGVIHKATQGTTYTDSAYAARRPQALAAGLMWGAYHFATAGDGQAQAEYFLSVVNPQPTDLLVLDFEQNYDSSGNPIPSMSIADAENFLTHVYQQTGRWPGLYGGSYLKEQLGNESNPTLANCWLWIAQYTSGSPTIPPNWPLWTMWQYTESGSVSGVSGNVDRDKFNGSLAGLQRLWGVA